MNIGIDDEVELQRADNFEQAKLLEQKISRLEKLVKSRDDALNELYEVEKSKNDEITSLKERIKQDGIETSKLQNIIKTQNDEINSLNEKICDLEQQSINNLKQQQMIEASSPRIVENLLTDKESLYKEIADLRLQISQLEGILQEKEDDLTALQTKFSEFENKKENEIQLLLNESKDTKSLLSEMEKSSKDAYDSKVNLLEEDIDSLKSDCLELLKLISLLYMKSESREVENYEDMKDTSNMIIDSLSLSDKTKKIINDFSNSDQNFSQKAISFPLELSNQIYNSLKSSTNSKDCYSEKNEKPINLIKRFTITRLSDILTNQTPLCSVNHTESLYEEREYIIQNIDTEYSIIKQFLSEVLIDSEESAKDSPLNIFQMLVDVLFLDIYKPCAHTNKNSCRDCESTVINRECKDYLKTELVFKLIIKSVLDNDPEPLIANLNKIISEINSEQSGLKKIELEEDCDTVEKFNVKTLIDSLVKLSIGYGWTILHIFSYLEHTETLQLFLEHFSFEEQMSIVNRKSFSGFIPISLSILKDNLLITELFLTCGSDVQTVDNRRNTLLHFAINTDIQEVLIKRRVPLNAKNSSGQLANVIQPKSQILKLDFGRMDYSDSSESLDIESQSQKSNKKQIGIESEHSESSYGLKPFQNPALDSQESENKVILSAWISGNEPISSCKDDFCVFSIPEFESCDSDVSEPSVWNMLGFATNRNISSIYKGKNGDHAAMEQNIDRLEEMGLTQSEKKNGIWSDIVINYTARGLEKSCFPPPLDCPINLFRQILVLTTERFALFQYSPLKLLQAAPIMDLEEIIVPRNSNVLLLLKVDGWDDILLEVNRRSEFLDELTTLYRTLTTPPEILLSQTAPKASSENSVSKAEKSSSFWLGFMGKNNSSETTSEQKPSVLSPERASAFQNLISVYGENPPIVSEPDNLIGLFNSENKYSIVLAIINRGSFMLLPHRETSLLVSVPTYHFGFLGICINPPLALENPLSQQKKQSSSSTTSSKNELSENRLWQERFFILRSDGALIWCHHPNDTVICETIPIRFVRQIRVFNLTTSKENEFIPCFALDFTKNSLPSSLILHSDSSEMRDKWVEKIHNVRTILSESIPNISLFSMSSKVHSHSGVVGIYLRNTVKFLIRGKMKGQCKFNTADFKEINNFNSYSESDWFPDNHDNVLLKLNHLRTNFLLHHISNKSANLNGPLSGKKILDVGSGAGFFSEKLAELGGDVLGIDQSYKSIEIAHNHALRKPNYFSEILKLNNEEISSYIMNEPKPRSLKYFEGGVEHIQPIGIFDIIVASEVIEHVSDTNTFVQLISKFKYKVFNVILLFIGKLLKSNGVVMFTTLNRTILCYIYSIIFGEKILEMIPKVNSLKIS
ncbi:pleckstrin homology domain-containing protein [Cryptosporidium canis]|uniref:Pleckstrin homology domain-containing protein n=1 Tax=Cryptosporidium canis TaxID=195482 RepID=A0A9D5HWI0_9CRYT|nr:pleckstrin homology domain-containing protein [Cryptosporidium canis]